MYFSSNQQAFFLVTEVYILSFFKVISLQVHMTTTNDTYKKDEEEEEKER
jgi:hypothetical protein